MIGLGIVLYIYIYIYIYNFGLCSMVSFFNLFFDEVLWCAILIYCENVLKFCFAYRRILEIKLKKV